jgi:Holliday junction resolvase RusA-like endonuclease
MTGIIIHTKHIAPSVNACYANVRGKGRVRTQRYKQWATAAGWDMNGHGSVDGPFTVTITVDRRKRHPLADCDNFIKPTVDLLQTHGVITNDRLCESVTCRWGDAEGGMTIHIEPYGVRAA